MLSENIWIFLSYTQGKAPSKHISYILLITWIHPCVAPWTFRVQVTWCDDKVMGNYFVA